MEQHFTSLVERLTLEEIELLNYLINKEATTRFSGRTKQEIMSELNFSEPTIRKIICRLEAMNFIEVVAGNRKHLIHINQYGLQAIQKLYEGCCL
mgnify:FL=1